MTIYLAHSTKYDFQTELYEPIRQSSAYKANTIIFPHESTPVDSKQTIIDCDLVIAEVSYLSTGLGIELGWADSLKKPIICIHKTDYPPSRALRFICDQFFSYADATDLTKLLDRLIPQQEG